MVIEKRKNDETNGIFVNGMGTKSWRKQEGMGSIKKELINYVRVPMINVIIITANMY